jgi:AhpD family alkylhydroperoxidase
MQPRMKNPAFVVPDALQALHGVGKVIKDPGVPEATMALTHLRASQINGCSVCVDMHARELKKGGASDERIWAVGAWRESPHFTDSERAALALTEAVTRLADRADPVPDELWEEVRRHYDERAVAALLLSIAMVNVWNRLNAATRQVPGSWGG